MANPNPNPNPNPYPNQDAFTIRPLPRTKTGGLQKLRYALQLDTETPTFVLHMNRNVQLHSSDQRYVENIIRKRWPHTLSLTLTLPLPRTLHLTRSRSRT